MRSLKPVWILFVLFSFATATADARLWKDASGHFEVEAEAIAFNAKTVVLKNPSGDLVAVAIQELSNDDQEYIRSKDTSAKLGKSAEEMQTWTTRDGMKVRARVLAYGRKDLRIQRKSGHVHADDKQFSEIDPLHQKLLLKVLSKLEEHDIADEKALDQWGKKLGGEPRIFKIEGVLMKLESGEEIGVPFFLFAEEELAILEPGWKRWLDQTSTKEQKEQEDLFVRSQAMAYQQDRTTQRQVEQLNLTMLATVTGIVSIWEVRLTSFQVGPVCVLVPAANSQIASNLALQRYPGFTVSGVRRRSR